MVMDMPANALLIFWNSEHMSLGCKQFPRIKTTLDEVSYLGVLSTECEHVIRMLYEMREDLRLQVDSEKNPETQQDIILFEFAQFCAWAIEIIQNRDIPLGVGLSTVLYLAVGLRDVLKSVDFEKLWNEVDRAPDLIAGFIALREECVHGFDSASWGYISAIVENLYYSSLEKNVTDKKIMVDIKPFFLGKADRKVVLLKGLYDIWQTSISTAVF